MDRPRISPHAGEGAAAARQAHATSGQYGDIEAGFKEAALVLDEPSSSQNTSHQPLEPRTAMAYWQNGKLYLHGGTQSTVQTVGVDRALGRHSSRERRAHQRVHGRRLRQPDPRRRSSMAIPALLSKKANAPVMMRITREEEHYIGRARPALHARVKVGFDKDGRITALDLFAIVENGPYDASGRLRGRRPTSISLALSAEGDAMARHADGADQHAAARRAARAGRDAGHRADGADHRARRRASSGSTRSPSAGSTRRQARRKFGAADARAASSATSRARSSRKRSTRAPSSSTGRRRRRAAASASASKVRGVRRRASARTRPVRSASTACSSSSPTARCSSSPASATSARTSVIDVHRVAAEMLGVPWEQCEVVWGDTSQEPAVDAASSGGSQTTHAMTRAAHAVGTDAKKKLQEIAAKTLGGSPASYQVADGRVSGGGRSMTLRRRRRRRSSLAASTTATSCPRTSTPSRRRRRRRWPARA